MEQKNNAGLVEYPVPLGGRFAFVRMPSDATRIEFFRVIDCLRALMPDEPNTTTKPMCYFATS